MTQKIAPKLVFSCRVDPRTLLTIVRFYSRVGVFLPSRSGVIELALRDHAEICSKGQPPIDSVEAALEELDSILPGAATINKKSQPSIAMAILNEETRISQGGKNYPLSEDPSDTLRNLLMKGNEDESS